MPDRPVQLPALREITLHDTLHRRDPAAAHAGTRQGRHLRLRSDRVRSRPCRQRPAVRGFLAAQAIPPARGVRGDVRRQRHRRQRQDLCGRGAAGVASETLAREMTAHYVADTDGLGLGRPDREPLASATIAEIVALIALLIERGHAYAADGDVYFSVRSLRRATASFHTAGSRTWIRARAGRAPTASAIRSTSLCGRPKSRARTPPGMPAGAAAGPAGTSSARRWPRRCSASTSRSTAAART